MKNLISKMLPVCIGICMATAAQGQTDTLFWFAAPEVTNSYAQFPMLDRPIILRLTTYSQPATVTINQPAGGGMPAQTVNIPANSTQNVDLTQWIDFIENKPPDVVLNYGLKISSTALITAYYDNVSGGSAYAALNPEAFILKGQNALGTEFWIPGQNYLDNGSLYSPTPPSSSFDIVATENNTTVTITTANAITGHAAGATFTVTLHEGQTYSATAASKTGSMHVQGSRVVSDKPVAVTVKDDLLSNDVCADLSGDQIIPVRLLGTEYIAMNGRQLSTGDQLFITATQNGTDIINNGSVVTTINAGQTHRMAIVGPAMYVTTSHPAYVWQVSGIGCEVGAGQLPQIRCTGSASVSYVRATNRDLYFNLLVENGGQGNFLINGAPGVVTSAQFSLVAGTTDWYNAQVSLPSAQYPQGSVISIVNTSSLFHVGILNGDVTGGTSYGYFSNFSQAEAHATAAANTVCTGDDIRLFADTVGLASYNWTGPNGFSSHQQNPVIPHAGLNNAGIYTLTVDLDGCSQAMDTVSVAVVDMPVVNLGPDTAVCGQGTIPLSSGSYPPPVSYLWSTGAIASGIDAVLSGVYWLEVSRAGCKARDTVKVTFKYQPSVDLGADRSVCSTSVPVILYVPQPPGTQYRWSNGLSDTIMQVYHTGTYWLQAIHDGCAAADTVHIRVVNDPQVDIGPDTTICEQIPLQLGVELPGASYAWNTGAVTPYIRVSSTGMYILEVSLEDCIVQDTANITAMPPPDIDLGGDRDICPEQQLLLDATYGENSSYRWNTGDTTATYMAERAGLYAVSVTSAYGCAGGDSVLLSYYPAPVVSLGPDTTVCEETPLQLVAWSVNADSLVWSDGSVAPSLFVAKGGQYTVTGINKCGTGADTILVRDIFCDIWVPNAFTPNGDGINDIFRVLGNTGRMEGFSLSIFNRWGERLFYTGNRREGWDGIYKGIPATLGTYVYMLEYSIAGKPYLQKGNFHLIR